MMHFQFENYSVAELEECGRQFVTAIGAFNSDATRDYTKFVKVWFGGGPATVCVYSHEVGCEYIVDLCHLEFPSITETGSWIDQWVSALALGRCRMRLALESEWGRCGDARMSLAQILDDALKIALMRADAKVMAFASQDGKDRDVIVSSLRRLRSITADDCPWLWLDVPWTHDCGRAASQFGMLT